MIVDPIAAGLHPARTVEKRNDGKHEHRDHAGEHQYSKQKSDNASACAKSEKHYAATNNQQRAGRHADQNRQRAVSPFLKTGVIGNRTQEQEEQDNSPQSCQASYRSESKVWATDTVGNAGADVDCTAAYCGNNQPFGTRIYRGGQAHYLSN